MKPKKFNQKLIKSNKIYISQQIKFKIKRNKNWKILTTNSSKKTMIKSTEKNI